MTFIFRSVIVLIFLGWHGSTRAEDSVVRKPWTTSKIAGSPEPPTPYLPERYFDEVKSNHCLEMVSLNGRIYAVEKEGRILSFPETADQGERETAVFADLKALHPDLNYAYGLAFHPKWEENHEVYITYTVKPNAEDGTKLSRFKFREISPEMFQVIPESEELILTWQSGGHNGANLQFGPDGMLYISTGDATAPSPPDQLKTGQDNSDLLCCVLRIDINGSSEALNYRIPADNPYFNEEGVRPEIWAFGFRNPWKMSFDSQGRLWVGDVGWELWEMIFLVEKGGNYGWSSYEGNDFIEAMPVSSLAPVTPPIAVHSHSEAASITGGFVYESARLPGLKGAYIYADYETGIIWALRLKDGEVVDHLVVADTPHKIVTFGRGKDGDLYYSHYAAPTGFYRLIPNPGKDESKLFPKKLSETGLFEQSDIDQPKPGVYEFSIHESMWQDGATSRYHIALPGETGIETGIIHQANGNMRATTIWPEDAVLAKTISLRSAPIETQILHFDGEAWNGYSYLWNDKGTDALLVGPEGAEVDVDSRHWHGGSKYRVPSRAECMRCHTSWNQFTAAFEPMQLSGFSRFPKQSPEKIATELGITDSNFFLKNQSGHLSNSRKGAPLDKKARSWLHANCAHCHRRNGGGSAPLEVNFERSTVESQMLWEMPTRGDFGLSDARIVVPGQPWRSVLNYRISSVGSGHMPPLGSREVDKSAAALLWKWVAEMPVEKSADLPPMNTETTSSAMVLAHSIASGRSGADAVESGLKTEDPAIKALFERFRSPDERPAPRGLNSEVLLTLKGDVENGARLLSPSGKLAGCFACHLVKGAGRELGPDLSEIGQRLNRKQLLESLIAPSKVIAPEYRLTTIGTRDGNLHAGLVQSRSSEKITMKLLSGTLHEIDTAQVASSSVQETSMMPEGLISFLTDQETADLLAYLQSLNGK
ncbi:MAG: PQQ-dependent sugar dehydrogenase [Verrucomicrobiales bacterium]|nr:PQQ-dependent sugar dehydrogenase [Verrucomicrobiales bacterium]